MLYDFIETDKNQKKPMYQQIYLSIRRAIESGSLKKGSRLPSIRRLSADRGISKTTVTGAYDQLCVEGYIISKPQKGYFVAAAFDKLPKAAARADSAQAQRVYAAYDFSGKSIDESIIDLNEWKKCVKDVINRNYLLTSYGDEQGEPALREALQKYALGIRSVNARTDNIVVGAGTQAILLLLCSLIGFGKRIAVERGGFLQAELVFQSFNYEICCYDCDACGARIDSFEEISPDIILINPNSTGARGGSMPVTRRLEIIEWARTHRALILEDDYNGELRYSTRPIPCVQHYDAENTVYIGSFSKVLLPSVRLSYTVLPDRLSEIYQSRKRLMNQTASKTEQLALAQYIQSGKIDAHLRKARRVYLEKSRSMLESAARFLPEAAVDFNETALYLVLKPPFEVDKSRLEQELRDRSVRLMSYGREENAFALSFSGIAQEKLSEGVQLVCNALLQSSACAGKINGEANSFLAKRFR